MKFLQFLPFILLACCLACKKSHTNSNVHYPVGPTYPDTAGTAVRIDSFPLKVGNMWVYDNEDTLRAVSDTVINGMYAI